MNYDEKQRRDARYSDLGGENLAYYCSPQFLRGGYVSKVDYHDAVLSLNGRNARSIN